MKPVIIISIVFALLVPITVFAQSSEKTISYSIFDATASIFAGFVMLGIPILIILLIVLKKKGKFTGSLLKKILTIFGLFFSALLVTSIISSNFMSDAEKVEREERIAERESEAEKQQRTEQRNEELRKQREKESSIEYKMENIVLNYKGIDGKVFTI